MGRPRRSRTTYLPGPSGGPVLRADPPTEVEAGRYGSTVGTGERLLYTAWGRTPEEAEESASALVAAGTGWEDFQRWAFARVTSAVAALREEFAAERRIEALEAANATLRATLDGEEERTQAAVDELTLEVRVERDALARRVAELEEQLEEARRG